MEKVDLNLLKKCANNLMLEMSDEEYETLNEEFDVFFKQMEVFNDIEGLDEVTPMTFPFDCYNSYLREDEPSNPLTKEEVLKNAKEVLDDQIVLPKVVL